MDAGTLRGVQLVEFEILCAFDAVCVEHNLQYFLDSGTLLGAARHGGFIPWDDDVDIGMPRKDYERFLRIGQAALGDAFFLQTRATDPDARISYAKIRKNGTRYVERQNRNSGAHNGIWIDIFPFDAFDADAGSLKSMRIKWRLLHSLLLFRTVESAASSAPLYWRIARRMIRIPLLVIPESCFYDALENLGHRDNLTEFDVLTCFHYYRVLPVLAYKDVFPLGQLKFEGRPFPVLHNWRKYLGDVYGDWRQLPPENDRRTHDVFEVELGKDSR